MFVDGERVVRAVGAELRRVQTGRTSKEGGQEQG